MSHTPPPLLHHVIQFSNFNVRQGVSSHRQLTTLFYYWVKAANASAVWVGPPHNTDLHKGSIQALRELFSVTLITVHMVVLEVDCRPVGLRSWSVFHDVTPVSLLLQDSCLIANSTSKQKLHFNVIYSNFPCSLIENIPLLVRVQQ